MAQTIELAVVAPDRAVVETTAISTIIPGLQGYFGVLPGHAPMVASLRPGLLEYKDVTANSHFVSIAGGFVEVLPNKVTVLADEAQLAEEVDLARAEADLERARRALRGEDSDMSSEQAVAEIEKAMQRIKAARAKS